MTRPPRHRRSATSKVAARPRGGMPRQAAAGRVRRLPANTPAVEVTIDRLGARGDGVADEGVPDPRGGGRARPAFVPFALPGERVRAQPRLDRGEGVACEPLELLSTAPERVDPPCPHFMDCGGCALQHFAEAAYLDWQRSIVRTAFRRAGLADAPVGPVVPATAGSRRRADLVVQRLGNRSVVGFHERDGNRIVDLRTCLVLEPPLVDLIDRLREGLHERLSPGDRVAATANLLETGIDLQLTLPRRPDPAGLEALADLAVAADLCRITWRLADEPGADAVPAAVRRPPRIRFGGVAVDPPPAAFLQASAPGETAIRDAVAAALGDLVGGGRVLDLFCGVGTLTFPLLEHGAGRVLAVDGDAHAVGAVRRAADGAGLGGRVETETRNLFERPLAAAELDGAAAVVFDPPRAGARAQASALADSSVPVVVAVSCNPATLARDARLLVDGGYHLVSVTPIDQFQWTPHIELVAAFRRPV